MKPNILYFTSGVGLREAFREAVEKIKLINFTSFVRIYPTTFNWPSQFID